MGHFSYLKPIIHIGPPKTATTSLQNGVIPHLGRPFQIKPDWATALARNATFERPRISEGVIVSHESLGDFTNFTPEVILDRLAQVFEDATVVLVSRDPLELFYSFYRQRLINMVGVISRKFAEKGILMWPNDANAFFDFELKRYREHGLGFFQMANFKNTETVFAGKFDVRTISFDLARSAPEAFVSAFVDICGGGPRPPLAHFNKTGTGLMGDALRRGGLETWPDLCRRFLDYYGAAALTDDRADLINSGSATQRLDAFTTAFRFRGAAPPMEA